MTIPALVPAPADAECSALLPAHDKFLAHLRICKASLIKRGMGKVVSANEAPILKAVAPPTSKAEHESSLKGAVLCSCIETLPKNQPTNQPERKTSQKNLQRAVRWTNSSENILGLIGEVLTAAIQIGVMALYFLLSHHTSGSFEATVAGVHVVKSFK